MKNVTDATLYWYKASWKAWETYGGSPKAFLINGRERGVSPETLNCYARALNSYFKATNQPAIPKLKTEQKLLSAFTPEQAATLIKYKPRRREVRAHTLILVLMDTGLRISEALGIRKQDIDFDNLLITVVGKGRRQRIVPFSYELRKVLWKFKDDRFEFLFHTRDGKKLMHRNVLRNVKALCLEAKVMPPKRLLHAFRHLFALTYLRRGGSVLHLQKSLGHSSLQMSSRYVALLTEDLQAVHPRVSLLSPQGRW